MTVMAASAFVETRKGMTFVSPPKPNLSSIENSSGRTDSANAERTLLVTDLTIETTRLIALLSSPALTNSTVSVGVGAAPAVGSYWTMSIGRSSTRTVASAEVMAPIRTISGIGRVSGKVVVPRKEGRGM